MATFSWQTLCDDRQTLSVAFNAASTMKDASVDAFPDHIEVTAKRRLKNDASFTAKASNRRLTVTVPNMSDTAAAMFLKGFFRGIDHIIDDQGYGDATAKFSTLDKIAAPRDRVLAMLQPGETVRAVGAGKFKKKGCVIAVTDRFFRIHTTNLTGTKSETKEMKLEDITLISSIAGTLGDQLTLTVAGDDVEITGVTQGQAKTVASVTRKLIDQLPATPPYIDHSRSAASESSSLADLEKLVELHRSGILSEEEFTAAKARLLGL